MTGARLLIALLALALVTAPVHAARYTHQPILVAQGGNGGISLDQAVAQARQQHQGKAGKLLFPGSRPTQRSKELSNTIYDFQASSPQQ